MKKKDTEEKVLHRLLPFHCSLPRLVLPLDGNLLRARIIRRRFHAQDSSFFIEKECQSRGEKGCHEEQKPFERISFFRLREKKRARKKKRHILKERRCTDGRDSDTDMGISR